MGDDRVKQEGVSDSVGSLNKNICELHVRAELLGLNSVEPGLPFSLALVERVTENVLSLGKQLREFHGRGRDEYLQVLGGVVDEDLSEHLVKHLAPSRVCARAHTPDKGEQEYALYPAHNEVFVHLGYLLRVVKLVQERLVQAHE